jgi:UDP-2,3-diacylglucosamine pyrophosphatase LpxH
MKEYRPRLTEEEMLFIKHRRSGEAEENVLVVGDLHEPFCLEEYFDFCLETYYKYGCNKVVFIGDIIDNHFSSFHDTDPDGLSAGDELEFAIKRLKKWHDAFPNAYVTIGNHDRLMMRKAFSAGLSKRWIRDYKDVLECPTWNFVDEIEINDVLYIHGEGGQARARIKNEMQSIVQGHIHTSAYVEWNVGAKYRVFGMQVGSGIDRHSYAMAYGKNFKKPVISCGVVLSDGKLPIVVPMDL